MIYARTMCTPTMFSRRRFTELGLVELLTDLRGELGVLWESSVTSTPLMAWGSINRGLGSRGFRVTWNMFDLGVRPRTLPRIMIHPNWQSCCYPVCVCKNSNNNKQKTHNNLNKKTKGGGSLHGGFGNRGFRATCEMFERDLPAHDLGVLPGTPPKYMILDSTTAPRSRGLSVQILL